MVGLIMDGNLLDLNPQQREAVESVDGPVLVLAGAGSGKTRVITSRIIHLIRHHEIPESRILAMTFTNKAAQEMKNRVNSALGREATDLTVSTFHSFCARFLRREIDHLDRDRHFAIFDAQDQTACIKRVIRRLDFREKDFPPAAVRSRISRIKNSGDSEVSSDNPNLRTIFTEYQHEMSVQNAVDFDDLLVFTCDILSRFPTCRERYARRFQYVLVDEYQDTNRVQFDLLKHLVSWHGNICVVGDEDQSIYGWRGADIQNIMEFPDQFPSTRVFRLERNYRSTQSILDFANRAISANTQRHEKRLWTDSGSGEPIQVRSFFRETHEARFVAEAIERIHREWDQPWNTFAVLFRANYLSRNLEEAFRKCNIPFQLVGGVRFYERKEIKDLLSYVRVCVNPADWTAFCRAVTTPPRGIGSKSIEALAAAFETHQDVLLAIDEVVQRGVIQGSRGRSLKEFYRLISDLRDAIDMAPSQWIADLIERLDYLTYLEKLDEVGAEFRAANIRELLVGIAEKEAQGLNSLAEFMDFCALISDQDELDDRRDRVSLMTVHAAKGLEFDNVSVIALEDGIFPNQRALDENPNGVEEERRLFYVAVTRAKRRLFLTYAQRRQSFGSWNTNPVSRFLREADPAPTRTPHLGKLDSQLTRMESQLRARNVDLVFPRHGSSVLAVGDAVSHPRFGTGKVVHARGRGANRKVSVHFKGVGIKQFLAEKAPLEPIKSR